MIVFALIVLFASFTHINSQSWSALDGILPWESAIQLPDFQRPLGVTLNKSSLAHHHFAIGYLCLHSFMYDEAQEAFNLAINTSPTFVEAYIGKMLGCKHVLSWYTNFDCGLGVYNNITTMLKAYNVALSPLQSSLISTVHSWYENQTSAIDGERAFLTSISGLSLIYPNEIDIYILWGLSLLNVAYQSQYQGQMEPEPLLKARLVLKNALNIQPNHPAALHYIIHAYDVAQINTSTIALNYTSIYQNLVTTLSYAQHVPALIYMRTGSMALAKQYDGTSVQVSLTLCLARVLGNNLPIISTDLTTPLAHLNTTDQVSSFLLCDRENRAASTEWVSFSRLQTGNWDGTLSLINDLYTAHNLSLPTSNYYLAFAYRARARAIVNLFYWLPYASQFVGKAEELLKVGGTVPFVALGDDTSDWNLAWSEAGYRLGDCLRLLTVDNTGYNEPAVKSTIEDHLARFELLSNRTASLNKYVSISISMMIAQVRGIIYYQSNSFQECLNVLNDATQREFNLVSDYNSPALIFARSSELLAVHLLLINTLFRSPSMQPGSLTYMLNGTNVSVTDFPRRALILFQAANWAAPGRAINLLGMARANVQLQYNGEAERLYKLLLDQITSTSTPDPTFSQEAATFIANKTEIYSSANSNQFCFSSILPVFILFIFFIN